jgi:hypothetical protein
MKGPPRMLQGMLILLAAIFSFLACTPNAERPAGRVAGEIEIVEDGAPPPAAAPKPAPAETTWTPFEIAKGCAVRIAETPAALGKPLDWRPCTDGASGCREVATRDGADAMAPSVSVQGLAHGDQVTLAVFSFSPGPVARYVLAPRDGVPFFAIEGPREEQCSLGSVGLTDDGAVVEITFDNEGGYASRAYLRGPLRDDPAWRRVAAVLPRREFPDFIGESAFSAGGRVVVEQNGGPLRWFDEGARRWVEVAGSHDGWECCADGHGDAVTFLLESIPEKVLAARLGSKARSLRSDSFDGTSPVAIDGGRAVWIEGFGRDNNNIYERVELWAADVTKELALANAVKIAVLPRTTMAAPTFGGGTVAVPLPEPEDGVAVIRLDNPDDVRVLKAPEGLIVERILWVAADEIAVQVGKGGMHAEPSALRRIPLASLPPMNAAPSPGLLAAPPLGNPSLRLSDPSLGAGDPTLRRSDPSLRLSAPSLEGP